MVRNSQIMFLLVYTFVFPVDPTVQGKDIIFFSIRRLTMNFKTFVMLSL